ncbi:MAG TPA: DUF1295 domain-containing protein [Thermoflexia bacterium]|jgi:steroid 5-alpha reductase family enzyme|nr:DUF1295 domain-containing protein [Thermoflexia bacterium]
MSIWLLNAILIEGMGIVGVLAVWRTRRTDAAFAAGFNTMLLVTGAYVWSALPLDPRKVAVLAMVVVYLLHMNWLLLFRRRYTALPKLDTQLPLSQKYVLPFVLTNVVGWGYCLPFYFAVRRVGPLNGLDYLAFGVYVVGAVIHFGSDYQKVRFKARPDTKGKLLDTGFWALCRHPNYFGDFLTYVAFALIGGSVWGWISPLLNLLQYLFDAIPKNEKWAAARYGEAWERYVRRTRKFIPFVF